MRSLKPLLLMLLLALQSDAMASMEDSLRTKWINGKKYVLHQVESGETWTSLSLKYGCNVDDMIRVNNGVQVLKIGQIVQIPVPPQVKSQTNVADSSQASVSEITHMVKKGETLFAISRRYGVSISEIKRLNGILNEEIVEGRTLIIRKGKTIAPDVTVKPSPMAVADTLYQAPKIEPPKPNDQQAVPKDSIADGVQTTKKIQTVRPKDGGKPILQVTETGLVDLVQDNSLGQGNYYCLHKSAPIGTIIKMTDNESSRSVYLKVMGNIPQTERGSVIIRVSKHALRYTGVTNTPFPVELTYSILD